MRPYTFIFSTGSVDGVIAALSGYSRFSCREDFELQHSLRASVDAVMVGANTVRVDNPRLTVRLVKGRSPLRVVVDSRLSIDTSSRLLGPGSVILTSEEAPREREEILRSLGAEVVRAGRGRVDLVRAVKALAENFGVKRLMVEGGGRLNCSMLMNGLVDELRYTVAPYVVGGGVGLARCDRPAMGPSDMVKLALMEVKVLCGWWTHLRYAVLEPKRPLA